MSTTLPAISKAGSSKSSTLDIRGCAGYIAKLRSVLESATGDPPQGIDVGEVEHRIVLLQGALDEVRNKSIDLTKQKEMEEQQRYLRAVQRLIAQEERLQSQQAKDNSAKALAVQQAKEDAMLYFKDRNEKDEERARKCLDYRQQANADISIRAASNESRREKNLANLYAQRERKRLEARKRAEQRQRFAREVIRNKEARQEEKRVEMEQRAKMKDAEIELQLEAIRNARRSTWQEKKGQSAARSTIVWENGEAILATVLKDHEQLVKELDERMKGQKQRYAEEKEERDFYLQQQQQLRREREKKVTSNLLKLANQRLDRGEKILDDHAVKREKAENAQQKAATKYVEAGEELRLNLSEHQRRAAEIETVRQNEALAKAFKRWNQRAARIIGDLREAMDEDKEEKKEEDPWQNNTGRDIHPEPEKRPIRLPVPDDFAC